MGEWCSISALVPTENHQRSGIRFAEDYRVFGPDAVQTATR